MAEAMPYPEPTRERFFEIAYTLIRQLSPKDQKWQTILFWWFTAAPGPFPTTWSRRTFWVCAKLPQRDGARCKAAARHWTRSKKRWSFWKMTKPLTPAAAVF